MTKRLLTPLVLLLICFFSATSFIYESDPISAKKSSVKDSCTLFETLQPYTFLYDSLQLGALKLSKDAYTLAVTGFQKLLAAGKISNPDILTIVDFSQASTSKRMYIIDVRRKKLIEQSLVAHGRNTGNLMATSFSNIPESNQSSLGFYVTSETYQGKHGLSLRLDGMEKNINDKARERAIVIHGADYATENFCKTAGYLGRSFGCPAVPAANSKAIINLLQNGSCLFIYYPDKTYLAKSTLFPGFTI